jgi:hypothetical protein
LISIFHLSCTIKKLIEKLFFCSLVSHSSHSSLFPTKTTKTSFIAYYLFNCLSDWCKSCELSQVLPIDSLLNLVNVPNSKVSTENSRTKLSRRPPPLTMPLPLIPMDYVRIVVFKFATSNDELVYLTILWKFRYVNSHQ